MIDIRFADKDDVSDMQQLVIQHHYLHRPVDARCSVEGCWVYVWNIQVGLLMFGRPEATRCGAWYGSVDDVLSARCEVTRWQVLNLARVWLSPLVQTGGAMCTPQYLPGYYDRQGVWRSTLASTAINMAAEQIGFRYLLRRPPCFLEEPYEIRYLMSYCDRTKHKGTIYRQSGFELYRTNDRQIETWRLRLPALTYSQDYAVQDASMRCPRAMRYRSQRFQNASQLALA